MIETITTIAIYVTLLAFITATCYVRSYGFPILNRFPIVVTLLSMILYLITTKPISTVFAVIISASLIYFALLIFEYSILSKNRKKTIISIVLIALSALFLKINF